MPISDSLVLFKFYMFDIYLFVITYTYSGVFDEVAKRKKNRDKENYVANGLISFYC